uniref:Uncharacterized protein n=1 Tax=Anguilla anguilla TaxID=7936 RepID=A0A0E9RBW6_ANGAN
MASVPAELNELGVIQLTECACSLYLHIERYVDHD